MFRASSESNTPPSTMAFSAERNCFSVSVWLVYFCTCDDTVFHGRKACEQMLRVTFRAFQAKLTHTYAQKETLG